MGKKVRGFPDCNVSAWRVFFVVNEWVALSGRQRTSSFIQGFLSFILYWILEKEWLRIKADSNMRLIACCLIYILVYVAQSIVQKCVFDGIFGNPLQRFMDVCTMANISIFAFLDSSFGFYIHGRSPHGFSDTDMSSIMMQLQRESQNMCGKRGLLTDSDFQTYIVLPPLYFRSHVNKLLPEKDKSENVSQHHFKRDTDKAGVISNVTLTHSKINRFFCAFIDHAIKDMDYIIKEKSILEKILGYEFDSFLTENKGTFYIDNNLSFSSLFLYGNQMNAFVMQFLLLIALNLMFDNFVLSLITICLLNKLFQIIFHMWIIKNIALKTLIDKRFLI